MLLTQPEFIVACVSCDEQTHIGDPRSAKRVDGVKVSVPLRTDQSEGGF